MTKPERRRWKLPALAAVTLAFAFATTTALAQAQTSVPPSVQITDANGDVFEVAVPYSVDTIPGATTTAPATTTTTAPTTTTTTAPATTTTTTATTTPSTDSVVLGFAADIGFNSDAQQAIGVVNADTLDAMVIPGDITYSEATAAQWCAAWDVPLYLEVGNHEDDGSADGWIRDFVDACGTPSNVAGDHGVQWSADFGPVSVIGIAGDLTVDGVSYDYDLGSPEFAWLQQAVTDAGGDWVVVAVHKLCRNIDNGKSCSLHPDLVSFLDENADLVVHGHEHIYQRTVPLPATWVGSGIFGSRDSTCIGTSHEDRWNDPDYGDYATSMCEGDVGWGHGYARVEFTSSSMTGEWVNWENPEGYSDSWTVLASGE